MRPDGGWRPPKDGLASDPRSQRVENEPGTEHRPASRRGPRTVVLSAVGFAGLAVVVVTVLFSSLSPPDGNPPGTGPTGGTAGPSGAGNRGPVIAGTITVAPELRARLDEAGTLFIIARRNGGGAGPPFAVKRIVSPRFPVSYQLGPEDVMMAGNSFEGGVHVSARLTRTGSAAPPQRGDLEGEHPGRVAVGARRVDILIRRVR